MFFIFSEATEGEAPSISATFIIFFTLTDRRTEDSLLKPGYRLKAN